MGNLSITFLGNSRETDTPRLLALVKLLIRSAARLVPFELPRQRWWRVLALSALPIWLAGWARPIRSSEFSFALLGDRTGEAQAGVYEDAWREAAAKRPEFVLTVGDTIQGGKDKTLDAEWQEVMNIVQPYRRFRLFLTPGNHDIWDAASAHAFEKYAGHTLHYSFDWKQAHFVVLDDSRTEELKPEEMAFLEKDLAAHNGQPVKFVVSHRPFWLFPIVLRDAKLPFHQLMLKYGVQYVIAGHVHQMMRFELDGVTYLSMASSGGHLRNDKKYEHGWFFQHTEVRVKNNAVSMSIDELGEPFGRGRVSTPTDWGAAGLAPTHTN